MLCFQNYKASDTVFTINGPQCRPHFVWYEIYVCSRLATAHIAPCCYVAPLERVDIASIVYGIENILYQIYLEYGVEYLTNMTFTFHKKSYNLHAETSRRYEKI
jgi:hypothetical protein